MSGTADLVIIGAGIAGCAAAYHLAARRGLKDVVILDDRAPLSLTSDKGTQGYRNWWPGPDATMLRFVSRSIDIMEEIALESMNAVRLSRRGYLFVTAREDVRERLVADAEQVAGYGMGPLRRHHELAQYDSLSEEGFLDQPDGADLLGRAALHSAFPYLDRAAIAALHVRRAGWISAVALGSWSLAQACASGARFVRDRAVGVRLSGGRVAAVQLASGDEIATERVVLCAGPMLPECARMLGVDLQLSLEFHSKLTFRDSRRIVPRNSPFIIWIDPARLMWDQREREELRRTAEGRRLLEELPGGVHIRPVDGAYGDELYLIWTFETGERELVFPPTYNPHYADALYRGVVQVVPEISGYGSLRGAVMDGGYYCKTFDNRPLVGPLQVPGAFVCAALSGYGVMSANAAAELLAAHVSGDTLPDYAAAFHPGRLLDASYVEQASGAGSRVGQL